MADPSRLPGGRFIQRRSSRGHLYSVWKPDVPRISDRILDCVVYLYPSVSEAEENKGGGGSGFLVGMPSTDGASTHIYAVTNSHVVDARFGRSPIIRVNTTSGESDTRAFTCDEWRPHPANDDLAAVYLGLEHELGFKAGYVGVGEFITEDNVSDAAIGPGDDCFMVGRFVNHEGRFRNNPAVRFGNISAMPGDPFWQPERKHWQAGFLVEMRSLSGYSGSPVFWQRLRGNTELPADVWHGRMLEDLGTREWLLGVDFGHVPVWRNVKDAKGQDLPARLQVEVNSGQASVIPAWRIHSLLNEAKLVMARKAKERSALEMEPEGVVSDVELTRRRGPEPERLKIDKPMDKAVKRMFKKGRPPAGER